MLPHLHNGWQVDQAILSEEDRVVVSLIEINETYKYNQITANLVGHSLRSRLGPSLHENGRSTVQHCRESEEFCHRLFSGHNGRSRF